MVWLIIALGVFAYIVADAFFEVSARLSGWFKSRALPFWRSVWGAVVGAVPKRAAPAVPSGISADMPARNVPASLEDNAPDPARSVPDAGQVVAFLWKAKWLILILTVFVVVVGTMRGCSPPFAKSRDTLRAELKDARADTDVARFETKLANRATELADDTNRDRSRRERVIAEAEQEIEDAVSQADFDRLYLAYRRAYDGVWRPSGSSDGADPGESGPAPVRRSGGFSA